MDEVAYRQILAASNPCHCPFEKSVLTGCAACAKAEKRNIAEREVIACNNPEALDRCVELNDFLHHGFAFALHRLHMDGQLPHAQEMRVQCGGLKGLQMALDDHDQVRDVFDLVVMAQQKFGSLANLPLANTHYKAR